MKNYVKKFVDILVYDISYKTFMGKNPLRIRFDKMDGFIKIYGGIRYLVLLEYTEIFDKIIPCKCKIAIVLEKILIVILQESELIHVILDL